MKLSLKVPSLSIDPYYCQRKETILAHIYCFNDIRTKPEIEKGGEGMFLLVYIMSYIAPEVASWHLTVKGQAKPHSEAI